MSKAERDLTDVDAVFGALAHASRRHILLVLHYRGGGMAARDIAARFQCTWPTTTRHLAVLLDAGLVERKKTGRQSVYKLNRNRLRAIGMRWFDNFK